MVIGAKGEFSKEMHGRESNLVVLEAEHGGFSASVHY